MRKPGIFGALVAGLLCLLLARIADAQVPSPGQSMIEKLITSLTGGSVKIYGLGGGLSKLTAERLELTDAQGAYTTIENLKIDWSPLRLVAGEFAADTLTADSIDVTRLPVSSPPAKPAEAKKSSGFSLPVTVTVKQMAISRIDLAKPVIGTEASLALAGSLSFASLDQASADLTVRSLPDNAVYQLKANVDAARIAAKLTANEPPRGLVSRAAGLPDLGAIALDASLDGPRDALGTKLALSAGQLNADANGTVDLEHNAADLTVNADAPAMAPSPSLSWQSIKLAAKVQGPFAGPEANGTLRIEQLAVSGGSVRLVSADLQGDKTAAHLKAALEGLRIPGPKPDVLAGSPLTLTADAKLDAADRPVDFTLSHELIEAKGTAHTAGSVSAEAALHLPTLAPLAELGGVDLRGRADLDVKASRQAGATQAIVDGTLGITGGQAPVPGLIGEAAKIGVTASLHDSDVELSRLEVNGKTITLGAHGAMAQGKLDLDWKLGLSELAVLAPTVKGHLDAQGHVAGPTDDLATTIDLAGDVAVRSMPSGPIHAHVEAQHLPGAPTGQITADGELAGAPLALAASARRETDGALHVDISKADWKSAHAVAALVLPPGASLPLGKLDLKMTRLDDLRPFVGKPLSGGVTASLTTDSNAGKTVADIRVEAHDAGLTGTASVRDARLVATVADPTGTPTIANGVLTVDGFAASGVSGSARLTASGPPDALAVKLGANARNVAGAEAKVDAAAVLDQPQKSLRVSTMTANWKGEDLRLLAPVTIGFADGVTIDRLRAGLGQATIEVNGRASPTLDLTAQIRNVTPDLVKPFAPSVDAEGSLRADARLTGTPARPNGTVRLEATGLRSRNGPAAGLPPANLTTTVNLNGDTARLDTRLTAGRSTSFTVAGTVPLDPARALALQADGRVDLAMLDPILAPNGRRARGQLTLNGSVNGPLSAPRLGGTARLANGEVQDLGQGVRIDDIAAQVAFQGDTVRLVSFTGRAGKGTIKASGTIGVLTADKAIDITVVANNARPIASDRLRATLDADLAIHGALASEIVLRGTIHIDRAEINIPEKLPPSIAVLDVRRPGEKPPPPPAPGPEITLDLTITADRAIYVRGRGLFAEMQGSLRLQGTSINPKPIGGFEMRQGNFSIAGQTLTFTKGQVSFNGGSLTDPSLDFVASSNNGNVTAYLNVGGTASAPKITLTSVPELPQDEVLAYLLFKRSASSLSPFELAQIGLALASLTGSGPSGSNPLDTLRKGLGLDQLSVGSGANGGAALEGGRYVSPGVYVGAKQGIGGSSTQGVVRVDLLKGLKLEGTVGSGAQAAPKTSATPAESGGSSIGLKYQFEY